ncbi:MAG: RNA polymerase sigma factor [Tepidisphaeraceae bacterium]
MLLGVPPSIAADDPLPDLARRAQGGDRSAFDELVRNSARLVFAVLRIDCSDRHSAEDLVQETYLRAWRSIRSLRDPSHVRAWLLTIAKRALVDQARRRKPTLDLDNVAPPATDTKEDSSDDQQKAIDALRGLPEEYRLPLTMRYLAGADHETIRRQLGLTDGALRGLLHRGLTLLRNVLKE